MNELKQTFLVQANTALRNKDFESAVTLYEKALNDADEPVKAMALFNRDLALRELNRELALKALIPAKTVQREAKEIQNDNLDTSACTALKPHYGKALADIIQSAYLRIKTKGTSIIYDTIRSEFDIAFYIMTYPDIAKAKSLDLIQHYIDYGANEGRNPSPYFSTNYYVNRYPDVKSSGVNPYYHWLSTGRKEGYIALPFAKFDEMCKILNRAPNEVQEILITRHKSYRDRFENGTLGDMVRKAIEFEPLIALSWKEAFTVKLPPFHSDPIVRQVVAIHQLHEAAGHQRAKAVVVIPHCRLSGATRIAGHLACVLADIYGANEVIVLRTDIDLMQFPEWFPVGSRHVDLATAVDKLEAPMREKLLVEFLRSVKPLVVFNVNSRLFWDALRSYAKALSASMALYTYFFCNDKDLYGFWTGYPLHKFYRYFDMLTSVITDSHYLAEELRTRHLVPPDQAGKIVTFETPVPNSPPLAAMPGPLKGRRPQVFWSGRFDRQKRVDLVYALSEQMPEIDFHLWGEPVLNANAAHGPKPENVFHEGVYDNIMALPLEKCDVWLYTSEWDGVPNILVEIASIGIPIVGSLTGGTGEILREDLSWPVANIEKIDDYKKGVLAVLSDPNRARARAKKLRVYILARRSIDVYRRSLETILPQVSGK